MNHAVAGKKTFWVSPKLAEALHQTNLDVPGDVLRLPFDACAFVFNDAPTLEIAQTLIDRHTTRRAAYRTLTVCAFPSRDDVEAGFEFVFLADAYDSEWPYMISRSVLRMASGTSTRSSTAIPRSPPTRCSGRPRWRTY